MTETLESVPFNKKVTWLVENRDKFCVLPWLNLHTNPDGKIKLCCNIHIDHFVAAKKVPMNLGYNYIEDIWNGAYMLGIRNMMHANEGARECKDCYKSEEVSGHSPRLGQNQLWMQRKEVDKPLSKYLDRELGHWNKEALSLLPVSLELRLGNQCNLKCVTCWGMSSSLIHEEREQLINSTQLDKPELQWFKDKWTSDTEIVNRNDLKLWYETDIFFRNFAMMAVNLRRLYTTGGEPTLIKSNYKMFQTLLDVGNTHCRIEFTSNMTAWNREFYDRLEKFHNVEIQMSIDGIDEIGEYIRYPSDFSKVRQNVMRAAELTSTRPGWSLKCYTVLQALNFQHIAGIWELLHEAAETYKVNIDWWPITLNYPEHLSLGAVPTHVRKAAARDLGDERNKYLSDKLGNFYISHHTWTTLIDSIVNSKYDKVLHDRLRAFIKLNDTVRSLDGQLIYNEILESVEYEQNNSN